MLSPIVKRAACFNIAILTLILDQISKWWIVERTIKPMISTDQSTGFFQWIMQSGDRLPYQEIFIAPFFNIVMVWNKGVSFGLFNDRGDQGPLMLTILSLILSGIFLIWLFRTTSLTQMIAICLVIGGAIGNVFDRVRFGAVIDFLDIHAMGYHWPAFNIADSAIVCGIVLLIIHSLFFDKTNKEQEKSPAA